MRVASVFWGSATWQQSLTSLILHTALRASQFQVHRPVVPGAQRSCQRRRRAVLCTPRFSGTPKDLTTRWIYSFLPDTLLQSRLRAVPGGYRSNVVMQNPVCPETSFCATQVMSWRIMILCARRCAFLESQSRDHCRPKTAYAGAWVSHSVLS